MTHEKETLGDRIHALRIKQGWTLQELADRVECSKSHVWELENGKNSNPTLAAIRAVARAFGVAIADIIAENIDRPLVSPHLSAAIVAVEDVWRRAYSDGFRDGQAARTKTGRSKAARSA